MPPLSAARETAGDGVAALLTALDAEAGLVPYRAVLSDLDWVRALPNAAAPGYVFFGGVRNGVAVGGGGATLRDAVVRLAGETAEALAREAAPVACDLPGDPAIDARWTAAAAPLRIAARDAATGQALGVPAAAVFPACAAERPAGAPPRSLGLATGLGRDAARRAGLLELVERDAVARWWQDGARPAVLDAATAAAAAAKLARLRAGNVRPTTLLCLASPWAVPVVAALSRSADEGGWAFGFKAAPLAAAAARGAVLELLQMEIALDMAVARAARGAATPGDRTALARAALDARLFAAGPAGAAGAAAAPEDLAGLVAHLAARGARVVVAELGSPGGLDVAKVFATALRAFPGDGPASPGAPGALAELM